MTRSPNRRSRTGLVFGVSLVVAASVALLTVKMFEPVFVWNTGWKDFPSADRTIGVQLAIPAEFSNAIARANVELDKSVIANELPALSVAIGMDGNVRS